MKRGAAAAREAARYEKKMTGPERAQRRYWQKLEWTHSIAERFPNVRSVTIDHAFKIDFPSPVYDTRSLDQRTYKADDKALFWHKCISRDCWEAQHGGESGFDLTETVSEAIQQRKPFVEGEVLCEAWQDISRVGLHRCLTSDQYQISIEYADSD
jgi:hypothetical protein